MAPLQTHTGLRVDLCTRTDLEQAAYVIERREQDASCGEIVLRDGRLLFQQSIAGLWNRLGSWPATLASNGTQVPQQLGSWMRGIPGVLVGEPGLRSPQRAARWTRLHWAMAAQRSGLCTRRVHHQAGAGLDSMGSDPAPGDRVAVLVTGYRTSVRGRQAYRLSEDTQQACVRLAEAAGQALLEVHLVPEEEEGWVFAEARLLSDPFHHGQAGLIGLAHLLTHRERPSLTQVKPMEGAV